MAGVTSKPTKMTTREVEVAAMNHFNHRQNIIVPNVSWGAGIHECDLLVVRQPSLYGVEVEIKISKADLVKDKEKRHGHHHHKLKELWFAMPNVLEPHIEHVPERAGILLFDWEEVSWDEWCRSRKEVVRRTEGRFAPRVVRPATINKTAQKFTDAEVAKIKHLGVMRIQSLLRKTAVTEMANKELKKQVKQLEKELAKYKPTTKE